MNTLKTPVPSDARYTCRLEWVNDGRGVPHAERRFVIRFCGQWIVQATKLGDAIAVAQAHKKHRDATLSA